MIQFNVEQCQHQCFVIERFFCLWLCMCIALAHPPISNISKNCNCHHKSVNIADYWCHDRIQMHVLAGEKICKFRPQKDAKIAAFKIRCMFIQIVICIHYFHAMRLFVILSRPNFRSDSATKHRHRYSTHLKICMCVHSNHTCQKKNAIIVLEQQQE